METWTQDSTQIQTILEDVNSNFNFKGKCMKYMKFERNLCQISKIVLDLLHLFISNAPDKWSQDQIDWLLNNGQYKGFNNDKWC